AMANIYAPVRAGSDIVFLGALIRHVLAQLEVILDKPAERRDGRDKFFLDYLIHYTNAATLITEDYTDAEDGQGIFAGFQQAQRRYDHSKWRYDTEGGGQQSHEPAQTESFSARVGQLVGPHPRQDTTLRHER